MEMKPYKNKNEILLEILILQFVDFQQRLQSYNWMLRHSLATLEGE